MTENQIGSIVVDCAVKLHRITGPGLLESVYEEVLSNKLVNKGLEVQTQFPVPVFIDGTRYNIGFRADIMIEKKVILELKSVESLAPIHKKQLTTYLKLSGIKVGYLLNFGSPMMKDGIVRIINGKL